MLTFYYAPGACSMAAHIVLEEGGERDEEKKIDLAGGEQRTASYLKINPLGRLPVLLLDSGGPLADNTAFFHTLASDLTCGRLIQLWKRRHSPLYGFLASVHPAHALSRGLSGMHPIQLPFQL